MKDIKSVKVNAIAKILEGTCEGLQGLVVRANFDNGQVVVGIRIDDKTLIETTTDNIEQ